MLGARNFYKDFTLMLSFQAHSSAGARYQSSALYIREEGRAEALEKEGLGFHLKSMLFDSKRHCLA